MKAGDIIDLRDVVPPQWDDLGVRIELQWRLSLGGNNRYGASIHRRRMTASGKEGKPTHLLTLMAEKGESPSDLLRQIATLLEADKPIEVGS